MERDGKGRRNESMIGKEMYALKLGRKIQQN